MRYVWDLESEYFPPGRFPWPLSWMVRRACARVRDWDRRTAGRPHALLADSRHVAERIRRHWGRDAEVLYPPVEIARFRAATGPREYYLLAGAFAPYKRGELALEACRALGRRIVVVGSGPRERELKRLAPPGTEFRGWVTDDEMAGLYAGARALLFPGEEDFGIVPVEALASGCPVIAYARGGALETVGRGAPEAALAAAAAGGEALVPGGALFGEPSAAGLARAIQRFEAAAFDPAAIAALARPFAPEAFDSGFRAAFDRGLAAFREGRAA
jgi:glycosyltransferase involved in cell wall biosynthesis